MKKNTKKKGTPKKDTMKETLIQTGETVIANWKKIHDGNIEVLDVLDLITTLVESAETVVKGAKKGEIKHKLVCDVFDHFDSKYNLLDEIDNAIRLPFWLEAFDGWALKKAIDLLISQAVSAMNRVWKQ
ncbi:MAG: hypothetical protein P9M15_01710 [Candidatus Electryoneaceae bacterium]|nr:hypothetical protein [Candidatus Electryoneaceae bacterium]